ncbi:MAG: excinuclease ABC subunit UvrC [Alphaproteobacteria bacterium]|nr:excinuclease ABC subunit UvrC [Alphaproteobacteria bacterium]
MTGEDNDISMLKAGVAVIRGYISRLPGTAGVYRMLGEKGEVLYVGKAKSLKKRVNSYTAIQKLPLRLQRMVALTRSMEFVHTHTEVEALLLESNLIKQLKPRFNILLRDDKSFPYILIPAHHDFPQVVKHRGAKTAKGDYFGPFAAASMVNRTLHVLQKAFKLRNCTDSVFANRKRPCLQYHIKRCTAPCVGYVSREEYARQVEEARDFLSGKSRELLEGVTRQMQDASKDMAFEEAASYRDKIRALQSLQAHQDINVPGLRDADVFALSLKGGQTCIQVFFFRAGQNYGNRSYFPRHRPEDEPPEILAAMMAQFYQGKPVPREIIVSHEPEEKHLLEEALSLQSGVKISIQKPVRGQRQRLIGFALRNAAEALERHMAENATQAKLLDGVRDLFGMEDRPQRIEVYDNSHISGTNMVGAMIVAGLEGFIKKAYRKFNIRRAAASDDYAMMREMLERRFKKADDGDMPDLVLIDGGQGQFTAAREALEECGVLDSVMLVAIAKGVDRNAGREKFFIEGRPMFQLPERDPVLHYLQRLRDEAHRFAIGAHRTRRSMDISASPLDDVPGIGAKRKKALLLHFGSAKAAADAGLADLEKVEGISKAMAKTIYEHFRES